MNLDQLERVEPRQYPSGVPWAGECDADQPYRSLMWRGNWANLAIDVPYDHAMTVVPQYSSAPLLVAYRGALVRPEYQTVLALDPTFSAR